MATALGVHCLTVTVVAGNGLLIPRERRRAAPAAAATPAPQPT